ncbi:coiled-coil domain-containing protein [Allorhizocola rhizosphaerae]|uniref:coiled-coil domain-containing protein n=1 Tax=Allorhizocola rhizosphaerae TaxID=1872709 RepID=UPI001FE64332|nr:hypothetical protein [Allorhizocola rhizosphaerae]
MTLTVPPRRRRYTLATLALTALTLVIGLATPASAQPTTPPDEGESDQLTTLRSNLETAAIGYLDAEAQLATATAKQGQLQQELTRAELDMARAKIAVARYVGEAYKTGRVGTLGMILNATSPDQFLGRAVAIDKMTQRDQVMMRDLIDARQRALDAKAGIDAAIEMANAAKDEMQRRRIAAERALSSMGGYAVNGWMDPNSPAAQPAKRNPDGSWPRELCTINDPTTSGCITPRTLHAMKQAQANGFTRYVSCYRPGNRFEHPKGRACDFSAEKSGFVDANAGGDDKLYGDKLASFLVKNASALGVMYVVWYCKIWIAGGWKSYSSTGSKCGDAPAGDHTNHVHLSVY